MSLNIADCVSQCYNGASVMSGSLTGVQIQILQDNPRAIYIYMSHSPVKSCLG